MRTASKLATTTVMLACTALVGAGLASSASADDDGFDDYCSGVAQPQVTTHPGNLAPTPADDAAKVVAGGTVNLLVLANDTDPENDKLYLTGTSTPAKGEVCVNDDGSIDFRADSSHTDYTATFTYGVTDGDLYRSATVTVTVTGLKPVRPVVRRKLGHGGPARLAFNNPNSLPVVVVAGAPRKEKVAFRRRIGAGQTLVVATRLPRLAYYAFAVSGDDDVASVGILNTRTGRQRNIDVSEDRLSGATRLARRWLGQ